MATIKSYTDLSQSKKLAEFLPIESADKYWMHGKLENVKQQLTPKIIGNEWDEPLWDFDIPCWSLAALLDIIPKEIKDENYANEITPLLYPMQGKWYMIYNEIDTDGYCPYLEKTGSTPIDACYEMVLKLHELNLL